MLKVIPTREDLFFPFQSTFDKIFDELTTGNTLSCIKSRTNYPRLDVYEDDDFVCEVALPGHEAEDVEVVIEPEPNNEPYAADDNRSGFRSTKPARKILRISGKMNVKHEVAETAKFSVRELRRSAFNRYLVLPDYVVGDPEAELLKGQ